MAASLINADLFGNYNVDYMFVLGNMFSIAHNSPLYKLCTSLLQEVTENDIKVKEKDTECFILLESLCQLLQPTLQVKPYLGNSLSTAILDLVSSNTYCIKVGIHGLNDLHTMMVYKNKYGKKIRIDDVWDHVAMPITQKGRQSFKSMNLFKKFDFELFDIRKKEDSQFRLILSKTGSYYYCSF